VAQKLKRFQVHHVWELKNDLLRKLAELLTLPSSGVGGRIEELGDGVLWIFARAVNDSVFEFNLANHRRLVHLVHRHLEFEKGSN